MPAPVPALPNATGEMSAPDDCGDAPIPFAAAGSSQREQPPLQRVWELPERVVPSPFVFPEVTSVVTPIPDAATVPSLLAHALGVYRPPIG
jgi:hypothetical protein